jgi:hypothetical protein
MNFVESSAGRTKGVGGGARVSPASNLPRPSISGDFPSRAGIDHAGFVVRSLRVYPEGTGCVVLADPEGNSFASFRNRDGELPAVCGRAT